MRTEWSFVMAIALAAGGAQAQIRGAGSTFAASLYASWANSPSKGTSQRVDYEPVGSGAGVKAAQEGTADFGASDRPLTRATLDKSGLIQFPTAIGGVVMLTNIPGVPSDRLRLTGEVLAGIYSGSIGTWNDAKIRALNPDLPLPSAAIVPVYRSDGSGTSYVFTSYLSKVSQEFKPTSNLQLNRGKSGKTASEITALVRGTTGAIGYVDYAHARELSLPSTQLRNQWGTYVTANQDTLQLAMRAADWEKLMIDQDPTFEMDLTDAGCPSCWPIASTTYVLVPMSAKSGKSGHVIQFFEQAIAKGDELATKEGYVPLPSRAKNVVYLAMRRWSAALDRAGAPRSRRAETSAPTGRVAVAGSN